MNRLPVGLALALLAACASPKPCRSFPRCDIRTEECRAEVWREAQCTRGVPPTEIPPVRVIDVATLRAELEAGAATHVPGPDDAHMDRALLLLGLVPESTSIVEAQIEARVASLGAYYDPEDGAITVIDRGMMDSAEDVATLEHEMVHAVQDRAHDLVAFLDATSTTDEEIARSMLVEGEATTHMLHYYAIASGLSDTTIDWAGGYERMLVQSRAVGPGTNRWFLGRSMLLYPLGGRSVTYAWLRDRRAPAARFDAPPESAIEFFFDPFVHETGRMTAAEPLCEVPPPASARVVDDDRLGPSLLYAFLARGGLESSAFEIARAWEQDRLTVVASADELHTAVLWRVRIAPTEVDAFWSEAAWWDVDPSHESATIGGEIVLLASDDPALLDSWREAALAPCP